jgi:hypothetical protein
VSKAALALAIFLGSRCWLVDGGLGVVVRLLGFPYEVGYANAGSYPPPWAVAEMNRR